MRQTRQRPARHVERLYLTGNARATASALAILVGHALLTTPSGAATEGDYWTRPVPPQGEVPAQLVHPVFAPQAKTCGLCHMAQYEQWNASAHARATGPGLLGQLPAFDRETARDCLNCHAPRSEQQTVWFKGDGGPLHGVDCAACHLRSQQRLGPRTVEATPHGPVVGLPLMRQSGFCAPCHQFSADEGILVNGKPLENTYQEWRGSRHAAEGRQCQDCHMNGNHRFAGIRDRDLVRSGLRLKVERGTSSIRLVASNVGAGHALPTYITPRIVLRIRGDRGQLAEHVLQRRISWNIEDGWRELDDSRLMPDESATVELALPNTASARLEVVVEPDYDYQQRVYPFLLEQLQGELDRTALAQLEQARVSAGASAYVLYAYECPANAKRCLEITR